MNILSKQEVFTDISGTKSEQAQKAFYRFYSIDVGNRIALAEDYECEGDGSALALGKKILVSSKYPKIEVWYGKLRVGVLDKSFCSECQ